MHKWLLLQYETTYYIQLKATKGGEDQGVPSNILEFSIPAQPVVTAQPEINAELTESGLPEILITILAGTFIYAGFWHPKAIETSG